MDNSSLTLLRISFGLFHTPPLVDAVQDGVLDGRSQSEVDSSATSRHSVRHSEFGVTRLSVRWLLNSETCAKGSLATLSHV